MRIFCEPYWYYTMNRDLLSTRVQDMKKPAADAAGQKSFIVIAAIISGRV
jgi:hypothetical protein